MKKIGFLAILLPVLTFAQSSVKTVAGSVTSTTANGGGKSSIVCVTNTAGGTTVPATPLVGRRSIEIQHQGPHPIYCTLDGTAPKADGTAGRIVYSTPGSNAWPIDVGPGIAITCIAANAAQVSGACTSISEVK